MSKTLLALSALLFQMTISVTGLLSAMPCYAGPANATTHKPNPNNAPLSLGVFPRRNAKLTIKLFTPIADYLSKQLHRKVVLDTSKDFTAFWKKVTRKQYDLVHFNQLHYILSHEWYDYDVILKNSEFGESTIAGSILVRKDSGITNVQQLKDKRIVFGGGSMAMQSYIIASHLLQQAGLKKGDYIEAFSNNPPSAIFSAYFGKSAAAGAGDKVLQLGVVSNKIKIQDMRFLLRGKQLPHLPWAVRRSLPDDLKQQIQRLLSNLSSNESGRKLLKQARLTGLVVATDAEYDEHRKIMESMYSE